MEKIIDYKIVFGESQYELEDSISQFIKEGWEPLGGVCLRPFEGVIHDLDKFYQAMIKKVIVKP